MKVIIAGSRPPKRVRQDRVLLQVWYEYYAPVVREAVLDSGFKITEVACGGAMGMDALGEVWANANHVSVKPFPANWRPGGVLDMRAGYKRNTLMAEYADALVAVWDGTSRGTRHMISEMEDRGKPIHVHAFLPENFDAFLRSA